jgi:hypothetical protein
MEHPDSADDGGADDVESVAFYTRQSPITDPGRHRALFDGLPTDLPSLCGVVRGLILHPATAHLYGVQVESARLAEQDTRDVASILTRIQGLDAAPLVVLRPPERRFVGCCRDFSTLLCAMLRHQGVPARPRAGCARYFAPDFNVDHWICEYWRAGSVGAGHVDAGHEGRWVMVDAELDETHCAAFGITFDRHDVPAEAFLVAAEAWRRCRAGEVDSATFGVASDSPVRGWPYLQSQLVRDFASVNKVELLCWDLWGLADAEEATSGDDLELLDRVAALSLAGNRCFAAMRALYEHEPGLRVPPVIKSLESASGWQTARQMALPSGPFRATRVPDAVKRLAPLTCEGEPSGRVDSAS